MMKSLLIFATLFTLTACCGCMDKPETVAGNSTVAASPLLACSTAKVSSMTCEACAMTVSENLKKIPGIKQVQVDVPAGKVRIFSTKESDVKGEAIKSTIEKSGYQFTSLQSNCN